MVKSIRFMDQGAGRYLISNTEQYDQKNEMFKRPFWDPQMKTVGEKFYFTPVMPKDKPGYRLHDQSMVNASWLNKWFLWGDDLFGYGKKGDSDNFWKRR